jgi:hypothetical protein
MRREPSLTVGLLTPGFARTEKLACDNLALTQKGIHFDGPDFQSWR